jgi:RhoGEF, Guanine nucleotide exchange factor for Rho/Rac/Cdc42-like GTPases
MHPDKPDDLLINRLFTKDGVPLRILSTSLGIALLANAAFLPGSASAETASPSASSGATGPKLVEWSNEAVKKYYDPAVDWNLPLPSDEELDRPEPPQEPTVVTGAASGGTTTIVNTYSSGFGWDDLLLYHLLFNGGGSYSSSSWSSGHRSYTYGSSTPYKPKTYSSGTFQNKPVVGSTVTPKTSNSSGSITRRSTSSQPGGIGGKSSSLGSSSSSSGSSSSSASSGSSKSSISSKSSSSSKSSGGFGG